MKCPKCSYLGFETGDRCRNCGYDFSLIATHAPAAETELRLQMPEPDSAGDDWQDRMDNVLGDAQAQSSFDVAERPLHTSSPTPPEWSARPAIEAADDAPVTAEPVQRAAPALPLFAPASQHDDEPLVKLQAPRPPLAVRRTPEMPRVRTVPRPVRHAEPDPVLEFAHEPEHEETSEPVRVAPVAPVAPPSVRKPAKAAIADACSSWRRVTAAIIDHGILLAVDLTVVYFTLRMAALTMSDWRVVPIVPMLVFLSIVKFAYFFAFTSVGGQTIGKMATGIRVVPDGDGVMDASRALRRTVIGALSMVTLGLAFLPALVGVDRRAPHDRMARTRVVALPSV